MTISTFLLWQECGISSKMTPVGRALNLGQRIQIYSQVLTFFIKPQIWQFHVVVCWRRQRNREEWKTPVQGVQKLFFLPTKYANLWRSCCRRRWRWRWFESKDDLRCFDRSKTWARAPFLHLPPFLCDQNVENCVSRSSLLSNRKEGLATQAIDFEMAKIHLELDIRRLMISLNLEKSTLGRCFDSLSISHSIL